jgi:hypothetical protein
MAERNQLKIADRHGIAEDDPFAELTRIMGFDPREPARPRAAAPQQPEQAAHGDFDIDLEKELMGEFTAYEEPEQAAPVAEEDPLLAEMRQPAQHPDEVFGAGADGVFGAETEDAVVASLEQDFAGADEGEPEMSTIEPEAPVVEPEAYADQQDDARRHDAMPEQAGDAEVAAALEGTWFAPAEDEDSADDLAATDEGDAVAAAQAVDDGVFDAAASADLGDELPATVEAPAVYEEESDEDEAASYEDMIPEEEASPYGEAAPYQEATTYQEAATREEAAPYEEAAADEEAAPYEQAAAYEEVASLYEEPLGDEAEASQADRPAHAAAVDPNDFDAHFDSAMADVDMDFAARPQAEAPASVAQEAEETASDETVLHDEGVPDVDFGSEAAFDHAFADDTPVEPTVAATVAAAPAEPVAAPRENTLEDELNALLAKMTARPAVAAAWPVTTPVAAPRESARAAPRPEATPVPAEASEDDLDAALVADLHAMDLDDALQGDHDVDFDADAFHAALTEADDGHEPSPVAAPVQASNWFTPRPTAAPAAQPAASHAAPRHQEAPDVETIDVPERVVALADDLDIPDVPFEEPAAGSKRYDDLENEFVGLLGQMDATPAPTHAAYDDDAYGDGFRHGSMQPQVGAGDVRQTSATASASAFHPAAAGLNVDSLPGAAPPADPFAVDELAYDPDDTLGVSDPAEAEAGRWRPRRGLLIAGIVCAVAVAGGLGAMALSFGGKSGSDAPALVKADNAPIKVKPENPGGTVIPNQDNKVYEAVAKGIKPAAPEQKKLVTSNEEPVDVNTAAPQSRVVDLTKPGDAAAPKADAQAVAPTAKSEDRVEQTAEVADAGPDVPIVTPRKVRTMVVKPDGSLVPREDPAPKIAATEPTDPAPQHVVTTDDQTGAVPPTNSDIGTPTADEPALKPARTTGEAASTPKTAPIAPPRPSDQPVDVVGEVKPDKVASVDTTASTAASGGWSMQIASQPTADSAQSTYQDLARRYAGVLDGHGVNIVKADIAGKGTFYRVRVPTGSRNDAIKLCESYKAAGGNCFVSK